MNKKKNVGDTSDQLRMICYDFVSEFKKDKQALCLKYIR